MNEEYVLHTFHRERFPNLRFSIRSVVLIAAETGAKEAQA